MSAKIRTPGGDKAQQLASALLQRAPNLRCSVCGGVDFAMLEDPDAGFRSLLERKRGAFGYRLEATTLVCTNCGHVMQFADVVFKLESKPDDFGPPVTNE
ncbi:hypothetical protein GJ654_03330 [Rhodoblastus acidophilus]|uniref:Uncharacterized protein n=1 Tax=Rhodoblastus acidophilus TaxID=1074 RepID=A0A6N8DHV0_RHOAC|nr:hypothetical protein [Rhodoblastus acidophilus]MCW2273125.1 hypothetical protein [Rhodoblastus acidophilus]MTV30022.1 hypothetical protein [Rhodoblastus acidophilus]